MVKGRQFRYGAGLQQHQLPPRRFPQTTHAQPPNGRDTSRSQPSMHCPVGEILLPVLSMAVNTKRHNLGVELWQWALALSGESILVLAILIRILCRLIWACEWLSP